MPQSIGIHLASRVEVANIRPPSVSFLRRQHLSHNDLYLKLQQNVSYRAVRPIFGVWKGRLGTTGRSSTTGMTMQGCTSRAINWLYATCTRVGIFAPSEIARLRPNSSSSLSILSGPRRRNLVTVARYSLVFTSGVNPQHFNISDGSCSFGLMSSHNFLVVIPLRSRAC